MLSFSIFLFVAFLMLFLGGVVFIHDVKSKSNQLFFAWVLCAVVWMVSNYLENVPTLSLESRTFFLKVDFAAGMVGACFLMLFVLKFIRPERTVRQMLKFVVIPAMFSGLSFTNWHLSNIYLATTGEIKFNEGPFYYGYALTLIVYFVWPCILLLRARHVAAPQKRAQMTLISTGLIASTGITLVINLFLQNVLTADQFRIGIYAMLFFIMSVAWAIIRHEFLRIRFVVVELLFFGILAVQLTSAIASKSISDALINSMSFAVMLVLGFAMIRSFLHESLQSQELKKLAADLAVSNASLETANAHLKELDQRKDEFISIVSHQLRTPVAVMKGYISLMQEGVYGQMPEKMADKVDNMMLMNERLVQMIDNMLNVTRIEQNRIEYSCALVDVRPVLDQVVEQLQPKAAAKGMNISLGEIPYGPLVAYVDFEKLIEVLTNLVDNSIKYSAGGSVIIDAMTAPRKKSVIIKVTDHGLGMDLETSQNVFHKFFRSNNPAVMVQGGTGLGLYVCAMFVRGMGGDIWIEHTAPNEGTSIAFALPMEPGGHCTAPHHKITPPAIPPGAQRKYPESV